MADIGASVGAGGKNNKADVRIVQKLLNNFTTALNLKALVVDGDCGDGTIKALRKFQKDLMGLSAPDGRADPGGKTMARLNATAQTPHADAPPPASQLSGANWWRTNEGNYANSSSLGDLIPAFRDAVTAFIAAMREAGATVRVNATRRNRIRVYLMHYSWRVAKGDIAPDKVPLQPGCVIIWDHGDLTKSRAAAQQMVDLFAIAYKPSLTSRHIDGMAVDMTINWSGTIKVADKNGAKIAMTSPASGANPNLHKVGKSYGVIKLLSDPPHWSTDGH